MSYPTIDGYCALGVDREYDLTPDQLVRAMDSAEVDRAVVATVDRFMAVRNREGNDAILRAAHAHDERLIPSCSVNPWLGDQAVAEFRRATGEGARMLVLHPAVQGYQLNDELVWPLVDAAVEERLVVYAHTGPPGAATPWQLVDLAERFPEADFIMGHCGATDFHNDVIPATRAVGNVYLEASLARPFLFSSHLRNVGAKRGIMGSYAPLSNLVFEWEQMRAELPGGEFPGVYGANLLSLLGKRGPL